MNLWGEGPTNGIIDQSSASIVWHVLSNLNDATPIPHLGTKIGPIGHSEVPLFYEAHIVDKGLSLS